MTNLLANIQTVMDTAQNSTAAGNAAGSDIYVVLWITLIVWIGIFFYLIHLDKKLRIIKQKLDFKNDNQN